MAREDRSHQNDLVKLRQQLEKVADRRLVETFKNPNGSDEKIFSVIARITKTVLPDAWQEDPTRALIRLMRAAISQLPDDKPTYFELTWKDIGTLLYGFRMDLPLKPDGTAYGYKDFVMRVREEARFQESKASERTFGRTTQKLREMLAKELLAIEIEGINATPVELAARVGATSVPTVADMSDTVDPSRLAFNHPATSNSTTSQSLLESQAVKHTSSVGPRTATVAILVVLILTVTATVAVQHLFSHQDGASSKSSVNPSPIPASSSSPPVQVQNVTEFRSIANDKSYVLRENITMSPADLAKFNAEVGASSEAFSSWHAKHGGVALDFGFTNITLRGNTDDTVRITDMKVLKDCHEPFNGTFLQGYTQGGGEETIKVGFDLDSPEPIPQEMAVTSTRGLHPLDANYFSTNTISLAPGETETITIGAFTKQHSCTFRFRLIIATPDGSFSQDIDYNGKPFEVTAKVAPVKTELPFSGYRTAYVQNGNLQWEEVNPSTYTR
jgi:hypothetical protein